MNFSIFQERVTTQCGQVALYSIKLRQNSKNNMRIMLYHTLNYHRK